MIVGVDLDNHVRDLEQARGDDQSSDDFEPDDLRLHKRFKATKPVPKAIVRSEILSSEEVLESSVSAPVANRRLSVGLNTASNEMNVFSPGPVELAAAHVSQVISQQQPSFNWGSLSHSGLEAAVATSPPARDDLGTAVGSVEKQTTSVIVSRQVNLYLKPIFGDSMSPANHYVQLLSFFVDKSRQVIQVNVSDSKHWISMKADYFQYVEFFGKEFTSLMPTNEIYKSFIM